MHEGDASSLTSWRSVQMRLLDPRRVKTGRPARVGKHQDVEQRGAGSGAERIQACPCRRSTSADRGVSVSTSEAPNKAVHDRPCLLRRGDSEDEFLVGGPQRQVEERAAGSLLSHDRL